MEKSRPFFDGEAVGSPVKRRSAPSPQAKAVSGAFVAGSEDTVGSGIFPNGFAALTQAVTTRTRPS